MKVVYHHRIASKDGQFVHLDAIVTALRRQGHEVRLVGPKVVEKAEFGSDGGLLSRVRGALPAWAGELLEVGYNLLSFSRLLLVVARERPDVVYERYNLFSMAGIWASRLANRPLILEVNAPLAEERSRHGQLRLQRLARASERYVWRRADAVLPVTQVLADRIVDVGSDPERMVVIPNGCHASLLTEAAVEPPPSPFSVESPLVLGFSGFLRSWHGLETVLDVMGDPNHAQTCFLVVGDGPASESLERKARALGLSDRLHITGTVPHERVPSYVALFDVALQPEVVDYASPLKIFDYMAMACAIVAPDRPNIRELLQDGVNALLFEPGDLDAFRRTISRLVAQPSLRTRLGEAARRTARDRPFTWDANADRIVTIATRLLSGQPPEAPEGSDGGAG